ncbi:MAG: hypothetical protein KDB68_17695 [Planctomycetes bacterium]|nr:hypothetical protein [Planctomycetota bacterium]
MNPKTAKLIAAVMAEQDGMAVEIPTGDSGAATRIALALAMPDSGIAKAAHYARVDSTQKLRAIDGPLEAAWLRELEAMSGTNADILNDARSAPLGREIGAEFRRMVVSEQIRQLRAVPEPNFSFVDADTAADFRELAANPGREIGPYATRLAEEVGVARDTVRETIAAYRQHHEAQVAADRLQEFLDSDFSPAHLAAEAPSFKVSAIEDRAAIEVAAFREQQALEAEAREIERRKSELAKVHSDNNARRRAVSIEDEAARKQAAMKTVGESMQRDAEKARAAAEKDEADMRARGLPANV